MSNENQQMENVMKKQVYIVGCGIGGRKYLTRQALSALHMAELYIGEAALLSEMEDALGIGRTVAASEPAEVRKRIDEAKERRIAVLVWDDPGTQIKNRMYPALTDLRPAIIPGISYAAYASSRTGVTYGDAYSVDLRRKYISLLPLIETHRKVLACGDGRMKERFEELCAAGYGGVVVYAVENPGTADERLFRGTAADASSRDFGNGSLFFFLRTTRSARGAFGLPARVFPENERLFAGREVRAAAVSALEIRERDVVYVIGAGAGDIACEAALEAPEGYVFAIERETELARAAERNAARFGLENMSVIEGRAPEALAHLPAPDAAFIRCAGDRFRDMMQILVSRNPELRVVVATEDIALAIRSTDILTEMNFDAEELEIRVSRRRKTGGGHSLRPENPVYLVAADGKRRG